MDCKSGTSRGLARPFGTHHGIHLLFLGGHTDSRVTAVDDRETFEHRRPNLAPDSVAVLPFTNAGGEAGSDYLSDGITESLIDNLARIPQLKVRSRDSVFRLKGKDIDVKEAGSELGVRWSSAAVSPSRPTTSKSAPSSPTFATIPKSGESSTPARTPTSLSCRSNIDGDIAEQLRSTLSAADKTARSPGKARRIGKPTPCI